MVDIWDIILKACQIKETKIVCRCNERSDSFFSGSVYSISDYVTNPVFASLFEPKQKNYITYSRILGVFAKFRKVIVTFITSV